jgi:hypothetical protein
MPTYKQVNRVTGLQGCKVTGRQSKTMKQSKKGKKINK